MNPGLIAAVVAVLIDSVVTLYIGKSLKDTARTEIAKGVQDVIDNAPALMAKAMTPAEEVESGD